MLYEYRNALGRDKLFDEQVCDLTERVKKLRAEAKIAVEAADKREKKKLQTEYDDRISELTERLRDYFYFMQDTCTGIIRLLFMFR